jgi:hypothetical protein
VNEEKGKESRGGESVRRVKVGKGKESEGGEGVSRVKVVKGQGK